MARRKSQIDAEQNYEKSGKRPDRPPPFSGRFSAAQHKLIAALAEEEGVTLNAWVKAAALARAGFNEPPPKKRKP